MSTPFLEGALYVEPVLFPERFPSKILGFGSLPFPSSESRGALVDVAIVQRELGWMLWEGAWPSEEERVDILLRVSASGVLSVDACRRSQLAPLHWALLCHVRHASVAAS